MRKVLNLTVLVAALGYFVDMFDLTIFGVVRMSSLKELGVEPSQLMSTGIMMVNLSAVGMLIGGVMWGVLGDKKGRLSILFGSILLYSTANVLNAFVTSIPQYAVLRFIAGVGLAGELGAAVTLVSEMLSKEDRGYGTTIIAAVGMCGAVAASMIGQLTHWKTAYLIGGGLGFLLLAARLKMVDSGMFAKVQQNERRGDLRLHFSEGRFTRYLYCILVGLPIYFTTGILFTFSPELSKGLGLEGITAGNALLFGTIGLTFGDLLSGLLSQWMKSRKNAVYVSLAVGFVFSLAYFFAAGISNTMFYAICFVLGAAAGYWAVLVTIAAEQFGTNIRATVATSVPNFVRSSVILLTLGFSSLKGTIGTVNAAMSVGVVVFAVAAFGMSRLRETYGRDLDYVETSGGEPLLESSSGRENSGMDELRSAQAN